MTAAVAGTAVVGTEIAACNGAVAEMKGVVAGAAEGDDDDEGAEGDVALGLRTLYETAGFAAQVLALAVVEDQEVLAPVTEQNMCDPEEPPVVCGTFHWTHPPGLVALLR